LLHFSLNVLSGDAIICQGRKHLQMLSKLELQQTQAQWSQLRAGCRVHTLEQHNSRRIPVEGFQV